MLSEEARHESVYSALVYSQGVQRQVQVTSREVAKNSWFPLGIGSGLCTRKEHKDTGSGDGNLLCLDWGYNDMNVFM